MCGGGEGGGVRSLVRGYFRSLVGVLSFVGGAFVVGWVRFGGLVRSGGGGWVGALGTIWVVHGRVYLEKNHPIWMKVHLTATSLQPTMRETLKRSEDQNQDVSDGLATVTQT